MKKILLAAQNLQIGGIQRALINMLNAMNNTHEYDIDLFVFGRGELCSQIPDGVKVIYGKRYLSLISTPFSAVIKTKKISDIAARAAMMIIVRIIGAEKLYRRLFDMQKTVVKYDAAISYFNDVPNSYFNKGTNLYVSEFVNADKKIAWIHTDPILSGFDKEYCKRIYKPFDKIICVSDAARQKFNELLPEYSNKTETRHNVFDEEKIKKLALEFEPFKKSCFDIVTVARVDNASKRIDGILNICYKLKEEGISGFCWRIIGGGPDLNSNMELANKLGVDDVVIFEGEKLNPYPYIYKSDLFALYSAYEGFPLVIGEALILKTPILTTNYAAAREQIPPDGGTIADSDEIFFEYLKDYIIGNN